MYRDNSVEFLNSISEINNDLTEVVEDYSNLEKKYIKANNVELLNNLNKEAKVIFSYIKGFEKESLKRIKAYLKEIDECFGLEAVKENSFSKKDIDFVKIAHKHGKWTIESKKLSEKLENLDVPTALDYLTQIVTRFSPQEAAYSLVHAKDNGSFIIAALPNAKIEESEEEGKYTSKIMKNPTFTTGTTNENYIGPYNYSLPVSRQIGANDEVPEEVEEELDKIRPGSMYIDENKTLYTITGVEEGEVYIANLNEPLKEEQVKALIDSGKWKKEAAASKEEKWIEKIERLSNSFKEMAEWAEVIEQKTQEYRTKLEDAIATKTEGLQKDVDTFLPEVIKNLSKIEEFRRKTEGTEKKLTVLKEKIGSVDWKYSPAVEQYGKRAKPVKKIEEVLAKMEEEVVSPKDKNKFQQLAEQIFDYTSRQETFDYNVDSTDPRIKEEIEQKTRQLEKKVQTSLKPHKNNFSYSKLDKMLIAGLIEFNTYNKLCNCAEINAALTQATVEDVYKLVTTKPNFITAATLDNLKEKFKQIWDKVKEWGSKLFNFITVKNSQLDEINEDLDEVIKEL